MTSAIRYVPPLLGYATGFVAVPVVRARARCAIG
jgi:hypothetical protein